LSALFRRRKTHRRLVSNSKGFSSIVGAIFAVLVMISLISTVLVWSLSQNTLYNNTVTQTRQADLDRSNEKIVANVTCTGVDINSVSVNGTLENDGPLSVQIVTLWVVDANLNTSAFKSLSGITLKSGNVTTLSGPTAITVSLANSPGDSLSCWFITGRGNTVFVNPIFLQSLISSSININGLAQILGDFIPDYHSMQWAQCAEDGSGSIIGPWTAGWIIPPGISVAWRINATYYGTQTFKIDQNSMLFFIPFPGQNPGGKAPPLCYIVNYTSLETISTYPGKEIAVAPRSGGLALTLYFGTNVAGGPGGPLDGTVGVRSDEISGDMISLTIYGMSPSTYAQSFPLFAVSTRPFPSVTLNPTTGQVGTSVTVFGSNFKPSSLVTITYDGAFVATATTTSSGSIPSGVAFSIPSSIFGNHVVGVTDGDGASALATFIVSPPSVNLVPNTGPIGTSVTVTGQGFDASAVITITFGGSPVTTDPPGLQTDATGSFSDLVFNVPSSTTGSKSVQVSDGAHSNSVTFTVVTPSISLNPTDGPSGTTVTITGSNFLPNSIITVTFDSVTVVTLPSPIIALSTGSFSATFDVPSRPKNSYIVKATDTSSNYGTADFRIK